MSFLLRNISLQPGQNEKQLISIAADIIGATVDKLENFHIVRKAVDARKKPRVLLVYSVAFDIKDANLLQHLQNLNLPDLGIVEAKPANTTDFKATLNPKHKEQPIVIVGMGPAGLFCALRLVWHGLPATVLERGKPVTQRVKDVALFWQKGMLDEESNVQFGEGGAGTFSDGKLTCRLRDPNSRWILEQLTRFGAPAEICFQAKPHIGTDRLRKVVAQITAFLQQKGCVLQYSTRCTGFGSTKNRINVAYTANNEELPCRHLVLAIGHSARDSYAMLASSKLIMEAKPFAIGLRVEHPQSLIDKIQYGKPHPALPRADYALTFNNKNSGRSCYSFCMCPGGLVVASSSEAGMVVTNGMSNLGRNSDLANSALVVNVRPEDFGATDPLAGIRFQQHWERLAFAAGNSSYHAPASNLLAFLGSGSGNFCSSYRPAVVEADLSALLPDYVTRTLQEGIIAFGKKMKGFVTAEATLTGVETRTSAPLRILRGKDCQALSIAGLYPAGEGAGYAGGIMSAALDGVRIADMIAAQIK